MELTERCNNKCSHCYINLPADDARAQKRELSFDKVRTILEEAASLGCLTLRFTGGEPLLRDDFEDIYLFARKLGIRVKIFTNGTLITPHLAALFSRIPPGDSIQVSLYGTNRKTYETVTRRSGSFEAVENGLELLLDHRIPFVINAVVLPLTMDSFREFENWIPSVPEMNVPLPPVPAIHLSCRGKDDARDKRIKTFRISAAERLALEARQPEPYINDLKSFCSRFCRVPGDALFECGAGVRRGSIDAYGNLQPCLLLRHPHTVYDLKKGPLRDAVHEFFPRIRQLRAGNPLYLERCARCFLHSLCEQCPAVSWMETRSLDGWPEHFCEFTHAQARFIGLLDEGEKSWMVTDWKRRIKNLISKADPFFARMKNMNIHTAFEKSTR